LDLRHQIQVKEMEFISGKERRLPIECSSSLILLAPRVDKYQLFSWWSIQMWTTSVSLQLKLRGFQGKLFQTARMWILLQTTTISTLVTHQLKLMSTVLAP
jgi:hypothetical protein